MSMLLTGRSFALGRKELRHKKYVEEIVDEHTMPQVRDMKK